MKIYFTTYSFLYINAIVFSTTAQEQKSITSHQLDCSEVLNLYSRIINDILIIENIQKINEIKVCNSFFQINFSQLQIDKLYSLGIDTSYIQQNSREAYNCKIQFENYSLFETSEIYINFNKNILKYNYLQFSKPVLLSDCILLNVVVINKNDYWNVSMHSYIYSDNNVKLIMLN